MKKYLAACALCGLFAVPVLAANAAVDSAVKTFDAVGGDPAKLKTYCEMSKVMSSADAEDDSKAAELDKGQRLRNAPGHFRFTPTGGGHGK